MKKGEVNKVTEGKSSETPNRRGRGEILSLCIETPPVTSSKPGKKKANTARFV
jgi:hypothetical protein